jgi:hypothetical protein
VIDGEQNMSISDVIKHICAKDFRGASRVWKNLSDKKKEEVWQKRSHFQFPGQGQSEQPVTDFKGILKLVMLVGGENAKKYRSAMVTILSRYYAGDGSLVDEIEANAKSNAPIAQMARASLAAEAGPAIQDEVSLTHKRKLEELQIAKIETELIITKRTADNEHLITKRAAEHEHLTKCTRSYQEICQDTGMDERARLIFKDLFLNMAMQQQPGVAGLLTDGTTGISAKPISLSLVAGEMGLRIPSNDLISIGVELKKRYVALHGKDPSKHDQLCNGRVTKVNSYMESDRPLVEEILRWYTAGRA